MSASKKGTYTAEVISVIKTVTFIGTGTDEDPIRDLTQYWSLDGKQLAAHACTETIPYGIDAAEAARRAARCARPPCSP